MPLQLLYMIWSFFNWCKRHSPVGPSINETGDRSVTENKQQRLQNQRRHPARPNVRRSPQLKITESKNRALRLFRYLIQSKKLFVTLLPVGVLTKANIQEHKETLSMRKPLLKISLHSSFYVFLCTGDPYYVLYTALLIS